MKYKTLKQSIELLHRLKQNNKLLLIAIEGFEQYSNGDIEPREDLIYDASPKKGDWKTRREDRVKQSLVGAEKYFEYALNDNRVGKTTELVFEFFLNDQSGKVIEII